MGNLVNSIAFDRDTERDLLHKQIDLLLDQNDRLPNELWETEHNTIKIKDEGKFIVVSWCQNFDGEDFVFVDSFHDVVRNNSPEYLPIDPEGNYAVPLGDDRHNLEISGQELMDFINKKAQEENDKNK